MKAKSLTMICRKRLLAEVRKKLSRNCTPAVCRLSPLELAKFQLDPLTYSSPADYLHDAQLVALFKKNPWFFEGQNDKAGAALSVFLACESACKLTNETLAKNLQVDWFFRALLGDARQFVKQILKGFSWDIAEPDFGPGSTYSLAGDSANIVSKLGEQIDCTGLAYETVVRVILDKMPAFACASGLVDRTRHSVSLNLSRVRIVPGNRYSTAPKTAFIDRSICVEPLGNMLVQKCIGGAIRRRLREYGYNLNSLQTSHGLYAHEGSITDRIATIDLSSASDTVCYELVKYLLPADWFDELVKVRCASTELPSGVIRNEKFSSMGNGYTFELETLVFLACSLAIRKRCGLRSDIVSCYGDDIVCAASTAPLLIAFLETCGFTLNHEKTFIHGPFRESCGKDFFKGFPVRPVYFKELSEHKVEATYQFCNRLSDMAKVLNFGHFRTDEWYEIWSRAHQHLTENMRAYGHERPVCSHSFVDHMCISPMQASKKILGDVYLDESDRCLYGYGERLQKPLIHEGCLYWKELRRVPRKRFKPSPADHCHTLACALYGLPSEGIVPRSPYIDAAGKATFYVVAQYTGLPVGARKTP